MIQCVVLKVLALEGVKKVPVSETNFDLLKLIGVRKDCSLPC